MIDKECRRIIKCCIEHFRFPEARNITTTRLQDYLHYPSLEIYYCCKRLNELGYFESFHVDKDKNVSFQMGYKMYEYRSYRRGKIKEFILKSVLVPISVSIIVSLITTLIALLLKG